jgi:hypothetical protein
MLRLLLGVKLRLLGRSLWRGTRTQNAIGLLAILAFLGPVWIGFGTAAHAAVLRHGADGAAAVLGLTHLGWLVSAFLFSAFAEGLDLRLLLRYPVRPAVVFVLNVLLAPLDLVALFLLPPLVGAVIAAGQAHGLAAALGTTAASAVTVLTTGVALHILLAALGRFLRKEWSRAVAGLLLGLAFAAPSFAVQRYVTSENAERVPGPSRDGRSGEPSSPALPPLTAPGPRASAAVAAVVPAAARLAARFPTTAFPTLMARASLTGAPGTFAVGLAGALLVLVAGVMLGTRWATATALEPEAPPAPRSSRAPRDRPTPIAAWAERLLGPTLAVLVARELRYWLRTPQILLGLLFTPVLVLMFFFQPSLPQDLSTFFLPFFCLLSVLNLSANQFGLDREGVRLLLLLPVASRQLVAAKNLAAVVVATAATAVSFAAVHLVRGLPWRELAPRALSVAATLPAVLMAGNELSTRHPWRMTFKIGGTPPGAMSSAMMQFLVVAAMAVLLALPRVLAWVLGIPALAVAGTLGLGALAWALWSLSLAGAARRLGERQQHLLDTLARPHESG